MASISARLVGCAFAFLIFGAFAVHGPFGAPRIEDEIAQSVRAELDRAGIDWAVAEADGQAIFLSGTAPDAGTAQAAAAVFQTLGPASRLLGPIASIDARAITAPPAPPPALAIIEYEFSATFANGTLTVEGMAPSDRSLAAALAPFARRRGLAVVDRTIDAAIDDETLWFNSARIAIDALSVLANGEVRLADGVFTLKGAAASAADAEAAQGLVAGAAGVIPITADITVMEPPASVAARMAPNAGRCQAAINRVMTGNLLTYRPGSASLSDRDRALLDGLQAQFGACAEQSVVIEGHTDSRGGAAANLRLSERRANAVMEYLSQTPNEVRFEIKGYGETRPISSNRTAAGQRRNRRIDFVVAGAQPESE